MKCKRCENKAQIQLRHYNAAFCKPCFVFVFQRQVERAIEHEKMFTRQEPVLVAVSGGKDSLALWDVLAELGYETTGLYLGLGIGEYSSHSEEMTRRFAAERGLRLEVVSLEVESVSIPVLAANTRRPACAACGASKRHYFDVAADRLGFQVLATGHNLDDEAARLFGNVIRWQKRFLAKQSPVLQPNHPRFARKVRPLFRISEYETAAYAFLRKIDYVVEECPNSVGATQLVYKELLNKLEYESPGSKLSFVQEFLKTAQPLFSEDDPPPPPATCDRCGMPSWESRCSFCSMTARVELRIGRANTLSPTDVN